MKSFAPSLPKQRIVKFSRPGEIVGAECNVADHESSRTVVVWMGIIEHKFCRRVQNNCRR